MDITFQYRPEILTLPEASGYLVDQDNELDVERRPGGTYRGGLQGCARSRPGEDARPYLNANVLAAQLLDDLEAGYDLLFLEGRADPRSGELIVDQFVLVTADEPRASAIRALCLENQPAARVRFKQMALTMIARLRERERQ